MKTIFAALLLAGFVGNAFADSSYMIIQKAREVARPNDAQQRPPPQSRPAVSPATATPVAPVKVQPAPSQQALARVVADLNGIRADHSDKLADDLMTMTREVKPSTNLVQKLAKDLAAALAGKTLTGSQQTRLAQNIQVVLAGMVVSPSQMDGIIAEVPAILQKAGVNPDAATLVGDDLKAVHSEIKSKATK